MSLCSKKKEGSSEQAKPAQALTLKWHQAQQRTPSAQLPLTEPLPWVLRLPPQPAALSPPPSGAAPSQTGRAGDAGSGTLPHVRALSPTPLQDWELHGLHPSARRSEASLVDPCAPAHLPLQGHFHPDPHLMASLWGTLTRTNANKENPRFLPGGRPHVWPGGPAGEGRGLAMHSTDMDPHFPVCKIGQSPDNLHHKTALSGGIKGVTICKMLRAGLALDQHYQNVN